MEFEFGNWNVRILDEEMTIEHKDLPVVYKIWNNSTGWIDMVSAFGADKTIWSNGSVTDNPFPDGE
jgi:hypothetical protein